MTDIQIFPNEYLNQKFLFIPAPQQNFHSGFQRVIHTIEFLTAAIQKNCGGPFESNILLCVTSHFFPLRNQITLAAAPKTPATGAREGSPAQDCELNDGCWK